MLTVLLLRSSGKTDRKALCVQAHLPLDKELVCMAMRPDLLAIGCNSHIMFLDPRLPRMLTRVVESLDGSQGVRSLCFQDELVSCGSGRGHLFFYDLRSVLGTKLHDLTTHPFLSISPPGDSCSCSFFRRKLAIFVSYSKVKYTQLGVYPALATP